LLLFEFGAGAGNLGRIGGFERLAQFFRIKADIVSGPVLSEDFAVAIKRWLPTVDVVGLDPDPRAPRAQPS